MKSHNKDKFKKDLYYEWLSSGYLQMDDHNQEGCWSLSGYTPLSTSICHRCNKGSLTAEGRKREKYALLSRSHHLVSVVIEISGALGPNTLSLLSYIGRCQQSITHDQSDHLTPTPDSVHCTPAGQCCLRIGHLKCYVIYIVYPVYVY